jgi:hypothetical protein
MDDRMDGTTAFHTTSMFTETSTLTETLTHAVVGDIPPGKSCFFGRSLVLWTLTLMSQQRSKLFTLDRKKMREILPREEDEPDGVFEALWYQPIINPIPETAYKYVGSGVEPDGGCFLMLVLNDGYDEKKLREKGIKRPESLPEQALQVLTPGIWPSSDQD